MDDQVIHDFFRAYDDRREVRAIICSSIEQSNSLREEFGRLGYEWSSGDNYRDFNPWQVHWEGDPHYVVYFNDRLRYNHCIDKFPTLKEIEDKHGGEISRIEMYEEFSGEIRDTIAENITTFANFLT